MTQISSYSIIKQKLQSVPLDQRTKGTMFEKLSKHLLREKDTAQEYKDISFWSDWKHRRGEIDCGIDLVIETHSGEFIAVQCKFYKNTNVSLQDLSTFFTKLQSGVGNIRFSRGVIISTSNLSSKALDQIDQIRKSIPIDLITEEDFIQSNIDWEKLDPTKSYEELPIHSKKKPRPHQEDAINATKEYFSDLKNTRGKLIMACGTGKTYTSLQILESISPKEGIVLFLAPSIALVSQTFREYCSQKSDPFVASIVCSDSKSGQSEDDTSFNELPITPSTHTEDILKAYSKAKNENKRFIIFSTYQSALKIKEAQMEGLGEIDLMICDEAHRSVGAMYSLSKSDRESIAGEMNNEAYNSFTICHSNEHIKAKKRIYMTATPKVYKDNAKTKAQESDNYVFSMDDRSIFGEEIYTLNFDQAIRANLLTDYKVIILALKSENLTNVANNAISRLKAEGTKLHNKMIDNEFVCKIIGTHKGLAKNDLITLDSENKEDLEFKDEFDQVLSRRAISFCRNIATSKNITNSFQTIIECYNDELRKRALNLEIQIDHIDGTMNSKTRLEKLTELNNPKENTCNILSNARCLSEGIDVPALDSIVFFDGRSAMVDIIQSVGRVMRKAPNKEMGYIILPIVLSESEINNLDKAVNNTNFQNIWRVLKSLRSHDPSLVDEAVFRNKIRIAISDDTGLVTNPDKKTNQRESEEERSKIRTLFDETTLQNLANAVYNVIPTKLGDKGYWESFSAKTAKIVETLTARLKGIFEKNPEIFQDFLNSLRENIHEYIKEDEAIDMICSHIITKPIFDVIFGEGDRDNPIGKALDQILERISELGLDDEETAYLNKLYKSVRDNAEIAKSQKSKQELIKNLYDTFLRTAFKKQSEKLGIVYTPIEAVDFILRATNDILKKHFNTDYNDPNVKIFDPFTGTGSFITRLLSSENNLISQEALKDKFEKGLFAQDIVLLSYYIALINITQTAQSRDASLGNFKNIALADSLDYLEREDKTGNQPQLFNDELGKNKKIKTAIKNQNIRVIVGNPPYSAGASSQNDNNANLPHPNLEKRVKETYGKQSTANLAKNTRDTLIQAIRMASDKLEDKGVLGFIVNGGFIDSTSADGFRKCLAEEFAHIYILNLRGNARTSGEERKKEGDGVFDSGSRASVAIIFLLKDHSITQNSIHYYDIGDYLSREYKLSKLREFKALDSVRFSAIIPNSKGDWINQRDEEFEKLIPLKKEKNSESIFDINSTGVVSGRDSWVYNSSQEVLLQSMQKCIDTYNSDLEKFNRYYREDFESRTKAIASSNRYKELNDQEVTTDSTKIAWTRGLKKDLVKKINLPNSDKSKIRICLQRPFIKQNLYWDKNWNEEQSQFSKLFPHTESKNIAINTTKGSFCSLISDAISDLHFIGDTNAYSLYYYDEGILEDGNFSKELKKRDTISEYALHLFQNTLKDPSITKEEIFYYIYAIFHHKDYLAKYQNSLKKEAPRVGLSKDFKELSRLGRKLAELHLNYESGEMHTSIEHKEGMLADTQAEGYYDVTRMTRKETTIFYNQNITITNIPLKAFLYQVNGKSAIDWIIERYQITTNKDSLIENNPNLYAGGKYIFELICRIIKLSEKSVDLIEEISKKEFE